MNYYNKIKNVLVDNELTKKAKDYSKNISDLNSYYEVGKLLIDAQGGEKRAKYGDSLIKKYSRKLTVELGKGYSTRSLKLMRKFYLFQKGQSVIAKLTWTHYTILLSLKDINEINYYIKITEEQNLSVRSLREKVKTNEYKRLPDTTKTKLKENKDKYNLIELIPNPILIENLYNIDEENIKEKYLKKIIIERLDLFLKQLGKGFMYVGNEYQIKLNNRYYYIDILLYNIEFNCYIVVELKVNELKKEDVGQVKFYMKYIDKNIKKINQDNTIGIILCKKDNKLVLEYASDERIYSRTYLIKKEVYN